VVGHSLGGAIALTMALEHPQQVAGLALLAPLTHIREDVPPVFKGLTIQSPLMRKLVAWTLAIPASIKKSAATLEAVFGPEAVPKDFATRGGGLLSCAHRHSCPRPPICRPCPHACRRYRRATTSCACR
jgi:pimeloyl-ACP methyl ester carboxylesterase